MLKSMTLYTKFKKMLLTCIFERINVFKEILWAGLDSTNCAIMLNSLCNDKRYMIIKAAFSCPI